MTRGAAGRRWGGQAVTWRWLIVAVIVVVGRHRRGWPSSSWLAVAVIVVVGRHCHRRDWPSSSSSWLVVAVIVVVDRRRHRRGWPSSSWLVVVVIVVVGRNPRGWSLLTPDLCFIVRSLCPRLDNVFYKL